MGTGSNMQCSARVNSVYNLPNIGPSSGKSAASSTRSLGLVMYRLIGVCLIITWVL